MARIVPRPSLRAFTSVALGSWQRSSEERHDGHRKNINVVAAAKGEMGAAKSRVSLFRATALQLNALQQNALYARQKNEGTGRAYRAIMVVRCFVNNVFSTRYPSSNGLQTGYDHFAAIIHRRRTFMRAGAHPLYDFFRVACTRASPCFTRFEKCFIAPIFLALSISLAINEKRSSCFFLLFYVTVFFFALSPRYFQRAF